MFRKILLLLFLSLFLAPPRFTATANSARNLVPVEQPLAITSFELVAAVNQLREDNGLNALNADPVLMQIAQSHAEYMAATGNISHISADGSRPFQRALAAGYSVAGDLSLGGFFSENILSGPQMSAQKVVEVWMGDAPHQNTMLSPNRSDMGAGIAWSGDYGYYVIDTGLRSSRPVAYTPSAGEISGEGSIVIAPRTTSTPQPNGSIVHTVQNGETLWSIAAVYERTVEQVARLNQINPNRFIYAGDELIIQEAATATPTASPTPRATSTRRQRITATSAENQAPPIQPQPSSALTQILVYVILGTAIVGVILLLVFRPRQS